MENDEEIQKLLLGYRRIAEKLNSLNEEINAADADGEDIIPGHDEGAGYWAKMTQYEVLLGQARSVREELRRRGYRKV
jgi:glyoxylase-like metal-dependent hydrolase (beta-lactamase superfamily II)